MRRSLLAYLLSGLSLLALYGVGGFRGWWSSPSFTGLRGASGDGGRGGGWGSGFGGGFRGGK